MFLALIVFCQALAGDLSCKVAVIPDVPKAECAAVVTKLIGAAKEQGLFADGTCIPVKEQLDL